MRKLVLMGFFLLGFGNTCNAVSDIKTVVYMIKAFPSQARHVIDELLPWYEDSIPLLAIWFGMYLGMHDSAEINTFSEVEVTKQFFTYCGKQTRSLRSFILKRVG